MVQITKEEAKKLRAEGYSEYIRGSHTRYRHFWMIEDFKALKVLERIRKENVVKSVN